MEKIDYSGLEIVTLFLRKLEALNDEERRVLLKTIDYLNHPVFISSSL